MKRTMTVTVDAPKHLTDKRVAFLLKGLFENGVELCESIVDAAGSDTEDESDAISLSKFKVKVASASRFDEAYRDLPPGVCDDHLAINGDFDLLVDMVQTQLDLIEEGQDGTEEDDPVAIRKWLKKWSKRN